jgi:glycine cleavage system transcriptional repressor
MAELAVTAIGADRPGIVAAVAEVLREQGGNLEDSAMTILAGHFAIMLLVDIDADPDTLRGALADATAGMGLTIAVTPAGAGHAAADPTHVLSVYGADRPGLLAGVSRTLAEAGANVTDLTTRVLSADDDPIYAMVIELSTDAPEALAAALDETCGSLGVDHTLRPLQAETY